MTGDFHLIKAPSKRSWIAHSLNMVFPGVGLIYWRRGGDGLLWLGISLGFSIGLISIWMIYPFLPQTLIAALLIFWGVSQVYLSSLVKVSSPTDNMWSRDASILPYLGLSTLCLSMVSFVLYIAMTRVYTFVSVRDMSMFPQLLRGDITLVDRRSYDERPFQVGELIAYDSSVTGITISRVIAAPDRSLRVEVSGHDVRLGDQPYHREAVSVEVPYLEAFDGLDTEVSFLRYFLEYPPSKSIEREPNSWLIASPVDPKQRNLSLVGHLGKNTLLVLPDVRSTPKDMLSHHGEIIDRSRVIGRPLLVISSNFDHPASSSRSGLRLR